MEFNLNSDAEKIVLKKSILLYGPADWDSKSKMSYASIHDVTDVGTPNVPDIQTLPGRPLSKEALLETLGEVAKQYEVEIDLLPANLLSISGSHLMWWLPAGKRAVYFDSDSIGKKSKVLPHPPLLFMVKERTWMVFALKANKRPSATTPLCHSSYFNVNDDGLICIGSTKLPDDFSPATISEWEKAFFQSKFTHQNGNGKKVSHPKGLYGFWKDFIEGDSGQFPTKKLVPQGMKLSDLLALARKKGA